MRKLLSTPWKIGAVPCGKEKGSNLSYRPLFWNRKTFIFFVLELSIVELLIFKFAQRKLCYVFVAFDFAGELKDAHGYVRHRR